ncbi:MAG: LysR family transcriptional regulator [Oscillospiraceae bacterium]|nr:LysR family transcriptional regulator [Oscillospiraceae bacterium]
MDITQLRYFISVAQTLNFTEAARRSGVTQPLISHHIVELEKQLGGKLFLRSRHQVELTEAGRRFLPAAAEIVELADKAVFQFRQDQQGKAGHLAVTSLTTSSAVLAETLAAFAAKYPDITVDIDVTSGPQQSLAMNDNKYDFHFAALEMVPVGETYDYVVTHSDSLCVVFPANHPLAERPLDFAALTDERFISIAPSDSPAMYERVRDICRARGYIPNVVYQYDRVEAVVLSVGAGLGISILPEALSRVFYAENVAFKRIPGQDSLRPYVVAWRKKLTNPAAALFVETVRGLFG